jgi:hypothetical protein
MKFKELLLVALVCANVTLAAVALTLYAAKSEPTAMAATGSRSGDYVMVSGPISTGREGVLVIDVVAKKANLYVPKAAAGAAGGAWALSAQRNLATDFAAK